MFNFTKYANLPLQQGPDIFGSLLEGYKAGKLPEQMRQAAQKEALTRRLLESRANKTELETQYLPQKEELARRISEASAIKGENENRWAPQNQISQEQQDAAKLRDTLAKAGVSEKELNAFDEREQRKRDESQAKINKYNRPGGNKAASKLEQAETAIEARGIDKNSPEGKKLMDQFLYEEFHFPTAEMMEREKNVPAGTQLFREMQGKNTVKAAMDRQAAMRETINSVHVKEKSLDEMQKILEKYPDLNKSFGVLMTEDINKGDVMKKLANTILADPEKLEAAQVFNKYANELALEELASKFGSRVSNARQKAVESTKPELRNQPGANLKVIQNLRERLTPYKWYEDEFEKVEGIGQYPFQLKHWQPVRVKNTDPNSKDYGKEGIMPEGKAKVGQKEGKLNIIATLDMT